MFFGNINCWVVLIATVIGMAVGFIWYAPWAFGKLWLKTKGWSDDVLRAKKEGKSMVPIYGALAVSTIVTAFVLAGLFNSLIVVSITGMLMVGLLLWLGFAVPIKLNDYLFGGDSFVFFLINVGYQLVAIVAMSLIIGIFG